MFSIQYLNFNFLFKKIIQIELVFSRNILFVSDEITKKRKSYCVSAKERFTFDKLSLFPYIYIFGNAIWVKVKVSKEGKKIVKLFFFFQIQLFIQDFVHQTQKLLIFLFRF
jgi:hypothetical protein